METLSKIISLFLLIPGLLGLYKNDSKDTEENFRAVVDTIGYENTIETAKAQTEIYDIIIDHYNSALPEGKTEKKAIVIGFDGCRADALTLSDNCTSGVKKMLDEGASLELYYCGGVNYPDGENTQATSTAPGWCSLLTGQWADKTGVYGNGQPKNLEYKTLMTELTENGTIDSAAFITKWGGHFTDEDGTYIHEKKYCEDKGLDVDFIKTSGNVASASKTISDIRQKDCSDFIIAIYEGTDGAGHSFGFSLNDPCYQAGYRLQDTLALATINAIEGRDTFDTEDWLIIISSDHGGFSTGHGGPTIQERMVFTVTNK